MKRQMRIPALRTSGRKWELNLADPWLVLVRKEQWILNHTVKPSTGSKSLFKEREIYICMYIFLRTKVNRSESDTFEKKNSWVNIPYFKAHVVVVSNPSPNL